MYVHQYKDSRPIKAWVGKRSVWDEYDMQHYDELDIEGTALAQLRNIAKLPFIHKNGVAVMPDVHAGIGATVGTVIATTNAIIPAAVGVDIGCGMMAAHTTLKAAQLPDSLAALRHSIERGVPLGAGGQHHGSVVTNMGLYGRLLDIRTRHPGAVNLNKAAQQMGTLGSGNHFIEVCLDENQDVWVMLHSGSRGVGNMIGRYFIERAKRAMEQYHIKLPDRDLAYLPDGTQDYADYTEAVKWAQDYAAENRKTMMHTVLTAMQHLLPAFEVDQQIINCHHNYVEKENHFGENVWVTRKGAIRARQGDLGIIPGSMGQRSYIVRGKGNPESYHSCSHGAGRRMSRGDAKRKFTVEDLKAQTEGVECRKDEAVLDEIPGAYKDIDQVMANQTDLVEVVHTLKQVLCVKGA